MVYIGDDGKKRCDWAKTEPELTYHDEEWGVPEHDDAKLFEMLSLEGAQAGLSWATILKKRENYRRAFYQFNPKRVAKMTEQDIERLLAMPAEKAVVRHRGKIESVINNAQAILQIQQEHGSFDAYIWGLAGGQVKVNQWKTMKQMPAETQVSKAMSKTLKTAGFRFVGATTCYAFMQACGMVNDHLVDCFRHAELRSMS